LTKNDKLLSTFPLRAFFVQKSSGDLFISLNYCINNFEDDLREAQQLTTIYWTSLSRQGCSGKITNCFTPELDRPYNHPDTMFWDVFDRTETGACVALQRLPKVGSDMRFSQKGQFADFGIVFNLCDSLNFLACEGYGPLSHYIGEKKAPVK